MNYGACIVETRLIHNLAGIVWNHIKHLPTSWGLTVFCSEENKHVFESENFQNVNIVVLPSSYMNETQYNKLLTSFAFWQQIPYDKVLIFQHDSEIFRDWETDFEQWDYIGSPWKFQPHGGNGGLSWRSVSAMKWCLQQHAYNPVFGNEDVFFSNILNISDQYKLAPREVCSQFSVETIYEVGTFGAHAIDKWLRPDQCYKIRGGTFELPKYSGDTTQFSNP